MNRSIILTFIVLFCLGTYLFISNGNASADTSGTLITTVKISVCGNGVKEGGEQCDGADLGGRMCTHLGYTDGSLSCSASCEFATAMCTTTAETNMVGLFNVAIGGSQTLSNGSHEMTIDVPAGFYSEDLRLEMFVHDKILIEPSNPAPSGKSFVGKVYGFVFTDANGNIVHNLFSPVTITLKYTESDTTGLDEGSLRPYHRGSSDSSWQLISGSVVDVANNTVIFSTQSFSLFALFASSAQATAPTGGGSNSGGGGSSSVTSPITGATFRGKAYPLSKVVLLKDAQVAAQTIAGNDANFSFNLTGLTPGSYVFSLYAEDKNGLRSPPITFPIVVSSGVTTNVGNIFISPTLTADKVEVKRGTILTLFGQTAPDSRVTLTINSENQIIKHIETGVDGVYLYGLDTSRLEFGNHDASSRTTLQPGLISGDSPRVAFVVGDRTVLLSDIKNKVRGDINNDGKVNIIDFSILAYWYRRPNSPANVDMNNDGEIDLVDFSILVFGWTG